MHLYGQIAFDELAWDRFAADVPPFVPLRPQRLGKVTLIDLAGRTSSAPAGASLAPRIALAGQFGAVIGQLTEDLVDGCHIRRVTRFDGCEVLSGEGICLRSPVRAYECDLVGTAPGTARLVPRPGTPGVLVGTPTVLWCGCGGRDDTGRPSCATAGGVVAPTAVVADQRR